MYRPTVRYDDLFKQYVNDLFHASDLDRNQIFRLALFTLPHSMEGKEELERFKNQPLPPSPWKQSDRGLWLRNEAETVLREGRQERDVTPRTKRKEGGTSGGIYINLSG